ncbi:MAG: hypothetical protein ACYDFT_03065 [Thermoplasmata archaeon]
MSGAVQPTQPLREQWGIFELEPGLRLWVRVMLPFVVSHSGSPNADQIKMGTLVVTEAADEFRGKPSAGPVDFQTATPTKVYETISETSPCEGLYLLPNQLIVSVKMRPIRARRYAEHAVDGDPIIQLDNEIQVQTIPQGGAPRPIDMAFGPHPTPVPASGGGT